MGRVLFLIVALAAAVSVACAKRYPVNGMVLKVDREQQTIVVSHDRIPGYMDAMAMPFRVRDAAVLAGLQPGVRIEFQLVISHNESYADKIRLQGGARFEPDTQLPAAAPSTAVAVGQTVPDFELTDQNGRQVRLSGLAAQVVAVTFIYTRCPLPDVCPRLSNNFARLQERFRDRLGRDLTLLSVTFDPQFDKPAVLAEYARGFKADAAGWRFLTGTLPQIRQVCGLFGVDFWPDEGLITHSMRTAVIDRQGKLAANLPGRDFTVRELGDLVETVMRK